MNPTLACIRLCCLWFVGSAMLRTTRIDRQRFKALGARSLDVVLVLCCFVRSQLQIHLVPGRRLGERLADDGIR